MSSDSPDTGRLVGCTIVLVIGFMTGVVVVVPVVKEGELVVKEGEELVVVEETGPAVD